MYREEEKQPPATKGTEDNPDDVHESAGDSARCAEPALTDLRVIGQRDPLCRSWPGFRLPMLEQDAIIPVHPGCRHTGRRFSSRIHVRCIIYRFTICLLHSSEVRFQRRLIFLRFRPYHIMCTSSEGFEFSHVGMVRSAHPKSTRYAIEMFSLRSELTPTRSVSLDLCESCAMIAALRRPTKLLPSSGETVQPT